MRMGVALMAVFAVGGLIAGMISGFMLVSGLMSPGTHMTVSIATAGFSLMVHSMSLRFLIWPT